MSKLLLEMGLSIAISVPLVLLIDYLLFWREEMRRKTYNEALLEDLNRQINHWQNQAHILRKERDDEKRRNDALTIQFERLAGQVEEKNKIIAGLER